MSQTHSEVDEFELINSSEYIASKDVLKDYLIGVAFLVNAVCRITRDCESRTHAITRELVEDPNSIM